MCKGKKYPSHIVHWYTWWNAPFVVYNRCTWKFISIVHGHAKFLCLKSLDGFSIEACGEFSKNAYICFMVAIFSSEQFWNIVCAVHWEIFFLFWLIYQIHKCKKILKYKEDMRSFSPMICQFLTGKAQAFFLVYKMGSLLNSAVLLVRNGT